MHWSLAAAQTIHSTAHGGCHGLRVAKLSLSSGAWSLPSLHGQPSPLQTPPLPDQLRLPLPPAFFFFFFNLCDLFSVLAISSVFILFKKVAIHLSSVFDLLFLLFAPSWAVIHFPWLNCAYDSQIQSFCPNFSWALDSQLHLDGPGTPNLVCSQPFTHLYLVSARIKTSVIQNKQFMHFCLN